MFYNINVLQYQCFTISMFYKNCLGFFQPTTYSDRKYARSKHVSCHFHCALNSIYTYS